MGRRVYTFDKRLLGVLPRVGLVIVPDLLADGASSHIGRSVKVLTRGGVARRAVVDGYRQVQGRGLIPRLHVRGS